MNIPSYFYVTTPIYYVNDSPHIGHAYTTILADVLARYYRLLGVRTWFLTGTDEHGQKVEQAARKNGITPIEQCNQTVGRFLELWKRLHITYDDFIRTTEPRHIRVVQQLLQELYDKGEIFRGNYEGKYCIPCERFFTDKDLKDGLCPECQRPVETISEPAYYFRMSAYQEWLIQYIQEHPEFIQPDFRRNETLGFLRQPLGDLCISRPKSRLSWGIELPFDQNFVCYVWFDALVNYISAIGCRSDEQRFVQWWPATYHLIGKDILTTHTVYWPCMLKAMGLPLPRTVFAHGWWLMKEGKMSKSKGNVVNPLTLCDKYGVDPFRYYLMAEMSLGQDCAFSEEGFVERYNQDLADNLGNMLNRVVKMMQNYFQGRIPYVEREWTLDDQELIDEVNRACVSMENNLIGMRLNVGIESLIGAVRACNRYFEKTTPWQVAKVGDQKRLAQILYLAADALRIISGFLYPIMPEKMSIMRRVLGIPEGRILPALQELKKWGELIPGTNIGEISALFPRIEVKTLKSEQIVEQSGHSGESGLSSTDNLVDITQWSKLDLRVGKVFDAEKVEKSQKLLKLQVDLGFERRQIIAGIAQWYQPQDLIGRLIIIVANLKPAKLMGVESQGMLLAAKDGSRIRILTVDGDDVELGSKVG